jgi:hypothetical protein
MQPSTRYAVVAIVICLIGLGLYSVATKPQPPDQQLITEQIVAALDGANAGSAQEVLSVVSDKYKDTAGNTKDDIRVRLIQAFSHTAEYHFRVTTPVVVVTGDTASSDSTLIVNDRGNGSEVMSRQVHIQWVREHGRKWLVVPISIWRVSSTDLEVPTAFDE